MIKGIKVQIYPTKKQEQHLASLFGDNLERRGFGGQAASMRGEPNAIGIPTKKSPTYKDEAFFSDDEFGQNKAAIDAAFGDCLSLTQGWL